MSVKNIIPGTGYFCVCDFSSQGCGFDVVFPDAILVEINDCEFKMTGLLDTFNLDFLENLQLRRTCPLSIFDKVLVDRIKASGAESMFEAEQLIYDLEAHGVKLDPSIHRKYKPQIHK